MEPTVQITLPAEASWATNGWTQYAPIPEPAPRLLELPLESAKALRAALDDAIAKAS